MLFRTENSTYELNVTARQIRRLVGFSDPTPRQGPDGVWKEFVDISPVQKGKPVMITWYYEGEIGKSTLTSEVKEIQS